MTIGYLLLQVRTEIGAYTSAKFDLSFGRLGPTEVRIMLAAVNLVLAFWTPPRLWIGGFSYTWVDFICLTMSLIFMAIFGASSIIEARKLSEVDP